MEMLRNRLRMLHPRNFNSWKMQRKERNFNHCHVLSTDPPIIILCWGRDDSVLHQMLQNRRLVVLYFSFWCIKEADIIPMSEKIKATLSRHPKHRIVLLCNEEHTVKPFCSQGIEAIFCNQNAFVNENVFHIYPEVVKQYSAVYNATMAAYKRHTLAAGIQSLMIITYRYKGTHTEEYERTVRTALTHASWTVDAYGDDDKATAEEITNFYNICKIGLCLSEVEGSMFVSMEYLLCGLPVVSTASIGGRDSFWDDDYVLIAEPKVEMITRAVNELIKRNIDPQLVRAKTLQKVEQHRERFRAFLAEETEQQLEIPWKPGSHGILTWTNLESLAKSLRS